MVQEWIATRMPVLSSHLSTKGRSGGLVKAAQSAARRFGEEMLQEAMEVAENLAKAGGGEDAIAERAWNTIERDGKAGESAVVGARLALESVNRTEGAPCPWDEIEEVAEAQS